MRYSKTDFSAIGLFKRNIFVLSICVLILTFMSCHPALKFASVKYDSKDINRLLDSPKMKYLTIQYNSPDGKNYKNPFTLISYARSATGGFIDTAAYNLTPVEGIKPKTFKGKLVLGNLTVGRDSIEALLTIAKTGEIIRKFDYLLFTPARDPEYGYIYYNITVAGPSFMDNQPKSVNTTARPCPPAVNCPTK